MAEAPQKQQFTFQAEIKRLLELLAHSLYQSKEIAVRELISNASDALDKRRYLALSGGAADPGELAIRIDPDKDAGTLVIADNGVGMTKDELVANLGTIAKSGSLEFLAKLSGDAKKDVPLIGQFGVGFYSAFMLADSVEVISRSCQSPNEPGWKWTSDGSGEFTVEPADDAPECGVKLVLHLKEDLKADFADAASIKRILRRYSGFLAHPIYVAGERANDVRPIWVEPKSQVTAEQYEGFYQHLTHRSAEKPLWHLHLSADSPIQFHALLFCPPKNPELLGFGRLEHGLNLCAKRVLVQHECRELLPEYLRFLVGLVDSQDLPLNISRETLQDNRVLGKIRTTLVRKSLDRLNQLAADDAAAYRDWYAQFGPVIKEGIGEERDPENRVRIAKLLRFVSTKPGEGESDSGDVGLETYVSRMQPDQRRVYYLGGPDLASIRKNPNLEIFAERGVEVLLLRDPLDEYVFSHLGEFDGKQLTSIDAAELDLPPKPEAEGEKKSDDAPTPGLERVLTLFRQALGDEIKEVRESKRLSGSPVCLVNPDDHFSSQMQKMLRMANKDFPLGKRILEVNPRSALIRRLGSLSANPDHDDFIKNCGKQLFASAMILEGMYPEPQEMIGRVQQFMETAAEKLSPIIT